MTGNGGYQYHCRPAHHHTRRRNADSHFQSQLWLGGAGGDYGKTQPKDFGGGSAAGVKIDPVAFLVIRDGITRVLPVAVPPVSTLDRVVEMVPDLMDKVEKYFDKKEAKETF